MSVKWVQLGHSFINLEQVVTITHGGVQPPGLTFDEAREQGALVPHVWLHNVGDLENPDEYSGPRAAALIEHLPEILQATSNTIDNGLYVVPVIEDTEG